MGVKNPRFAVMRDATIKYGEEGFAVFMGKIIKAAVMRGVLILYTEERLVGSIQMQKKGHGVCDDDEVELKICIHEGCTIQAKHGEVCSSHKRCRREGCTSLGKYDGLCCKHGSMPTCSEEGCTKNSRRGGVCWSHGAKYAVIMCLENGVSKSKNNNICKEKGCTNYVVRGGVCCKHGSVKKKCSHEGCTNQVHRKELCYRHGEAAQIKSREEGFAVVMGPKAKLCSYEGCFNQARREGACSRHEEETSQRSKESVPKIVCKAVCKAVYKPVKSFVPGKFKFKPLKRP